MKKEKILFLSVLIALGLFFVLCGYSLITCFVYGGGEEGDYPLLEIIYLFLHLIIIAVSFYLAFRAFKIKSSIVKIMTLDDHDNRIKKSTIISGILMGLCYVVAIYSTLHVIGLPMPPLNYVSMSFSHDLMNAGFVFGTIALTFFLYPFLYEKESQEETK